MPSPSIPPGRYWPLLWPLAYALHLTEEWFGGFSAWTAATLGREIGVDRFVLLNGIAWPLTLIAAALAIAQPRRLWPIATLASLFALNGLVHGLTSLGFATYAPGTITGLLLYLPLGVSTLARAAAALTAPQWRSAIATGIALHALVSLLASL